MLYTTQTTSAGCCLTSLIVQDRLSDLFLHWVRENPSENSIGTCAFDQDTNKLSDHYTWISKADTEIFVNIYGSGLDSIFEEYTDKSLGQQAPPAVYSANRTEWHMTEFAAYRGNCYFASLYDTLGVDSAKYMLNHAKIEILVCSIDKVERLLDLKEHAPMLKVIILMDSLNGQAKNVVASEVSQDMVSKLRDQAKAIGITLTDINAVVALGKGKPTSSHPPVPKDICSIAYTSGTSGIPKGVLSTHGQFAASVKSINLVFHVERPSTFSILPLVHCFEHLSAYIILYHFGSIGYYRDKILSMLKDIQALKPTFIAIVPRVLNHIYDKISNVINSAPGFSGFLAKLAVN
ncbi:medium-chain fatty acid-CoA ligase faa2 [Linderina macrospora]|uniref:Medium-chain fatty acid-CoA ligase faa2 n=1 Tax=Linderina macrospora TaxID=4868 RepID=A0ACC1JAU2_9FUNG|nr:medium-chain fatty acid-CoA ligase faa2 [Linderina macrospora]